MIYLDSASTTKPSKKVIGAMQTVEELAWGNPHSSHDHGIEAMMLLKEAEYRIMQELHTDTGKIFFTSGGSAANNLIIQSLCPQPWLHLVSTKGEHRSIDQWLNDRGVNLDPISGTVKPEDV